LSQVLATADAAADMGDAHLLAAAARRDTAAFSTLVQRHAKVVYAVVWRLTRGSADTEDMAQEAFLKLWKDPGQLRDASKVRNWLVKVASNIALDRMRTAPTTLLDEDHADTRHGVETDMEQRRISARIDQAIARLPARQKLALTLVQYEGFSNPEAAEAMEITVEAIESLLARARRQLKQDLAGEWQELLAGLSE
jgi:RNA polymerase sigma-70 factor, ECF subfamily